MKHLTTLVLVLAFGACGMQARDLHVQMTFSGTQTSLAPQVSLAARGNSQISRQNM
jgi:hypothetical protein